ncbi:large ribosomal subunit protein uL2m-like [Tubulanus polymorphus]|uniref:large ribosomal subunit protein uL2m-like n=1 Tax=Tubulanus polymorphus TaxID=672921 RepID=UPI003DA22B18
MFLNALTQNMSRLTLNVVSKGASITVIPRALSGNTPYVYPQDLGYKMFKLAEEVEGYTTRPLKTLRTGGRSEKGRVVVRRGGEDKRYYRMIDFNRERLVKDDDAPLREKVIEIMDDPMRNAKIAIVASGEEKRYIVATENMAPGDIITTTTAIPRMPVKAQEGDAHRVGALPIGTVVNCIERYPGDGGRVARSAGVTAQLVRKTDGRCIVRMPSKFEMNIDETCMATVGRVSNVGYNKIPWGKAGVSRWKGFRPRSGWWQRKDGRYGRKIRPAPPVKEYVTKPTKKKEKMKLTMYGMLSCETNYYNSRR